MPLSRPRILGRLLDTALATSETGARMARDVTLTRDLALRTRTQLHDLRRMIMDSTALMTAVATGLRDTVGPRLTQVLTELAAARAELAAERNEDATESAAGAGLTDAFNQVLGLFDATSTVPTPAPLPDPPLTTEVPPLDELPTEAAPVPDVPPVDQVSPSEDSDAGSGVVTTDQVSASDEASAQ